MVLRTLPDLLNRNSSEFPDHGVYYIKPDGSSRYETYPELLVHARKLLAGMKSLGILPEDKIILALEKSYEIIPVLWACFIGGIVPVIIQPPVSFSEFNPAAEKLENVSTLLGNPRIILSSRLYAEWKSEKIKKDWLIDFSSIPEKKEERLLPGLQAENLALIQFSSGSTNDPKGVMLTHRNILCNIKDIVHGLQLEPPDITGNWMPLFHDMGLFGFHITPVYVGMSHYLIEPVDFVKNPYLFLDVLHQYKITVTACPNFGQNLVNRYLGRKNIRHWDLSSVRVMFNGAEPISVPIMKEFMTGLARFDMNPATMFPAYGMAEATLAVTFPPLMKVPVILTLKRLPLLKEGNAVEADPNDPDVIELVNLGKPLAHCELLIVNDKNEVMPDGMVGHVKIKGENVSLGYYQNPGLTAQSFTNGWFQTGDFGFLYHGDLFITGRTKDIIFINGINFYAHDLEEIAYKVAGVAYGKIVIAGYFNEREGHDNIVVFVVGVDNETTRQIFKSIGDAFKQNLGLTPEIFIPIKSSDIPRTSSGKIQRYKLISRFLKGEFTNPTAQNQ